MEDSRGECTSGNCSWGGHFFEAIAHEIGPAFFNERLTSRGTATVVACLPGGTVLVAEWAQHAETTRLRLATDHRWAILDVSVESATKTLPGSATRRSSVTGQGKLITTNFDQ